MNNLIFSNQGIFGDFYVVTGGSEITSAEVDVINLDHYTNLQPLCSKINRDLK